MKKEGVISQLPCATRQTGSEKTTSTIVFPFDLSPLAVLESIALLCRSCTYSISRPKQQQKQQSKKKKRWKEVWGRGGGGGFCADGNWLISSSWFINHERRPRSTQRTSQVMDLHVSSNRRRRRRRRESFALSSINKFQNVVKRERDALWESLFCCCFSVIRSIAAAVAAAAVPYVVAFTGKNNSL